MKRSFSGRFLFVVAATAGLVLFALALRSADPGTVAHGVRRVGMGFAWILLIAGARMAIRAAAWSACAGGSRRLPFNAAFAACLTGEAAGSLTPLGPAASEPLKVVWVRRHLGTMEAAASLGVEALLYSILVTVMLVLGGLVWLAALGPAGARRTFLAGVAVAFVVGMAARQARRRKEVRSSVLRRCLECCAHSSRWRAVAEGLRRAAEILRTLATERPRVLACVSAMEVAVQALSVLEVWVTLTLLGMHVGPLGAFLMDTVNRAVTVAFKFVPLRLGVDEWGSAVMSSALGGAATAGVTVAVIRKARVLLWTAVGMVVALRRAASSGSREALMAVWSGQPNGAS